LFAGHAGRCTAASLVRGLLGRLPPGSACSVGGSAACAWRPQAHGVWCQVRVRVGVRRAHTSARPPGCPVRAPCTPGAWSQRPRRPLAGGSHVGRQHVASVPTKHQCRRAPAPACSPRALARPCPCPCIPATIWEPPSQSLTAAWGCGHCHNIPHTSWYRGSIPSAHSHITSDCQRPSRGKGAAWSVPCTCGAGCPAIGVQQPGEVRVGRGCLVPWNWGPAAWS
jgi:hypothetical protein